MNATFFHARIARVTAIALCAGASLAHAGPTPLGGATLDGQITYDTATYQDWSNEQTLTVAPADVQVTSTAGNVGFAFSPDWTPFYTAGYRPGFDYSYSGALLGLGGFSLTADPGYVLDLQQATVTVSGWVTLEDQATLSIGHGDDVRALSGPGFRDGTRTFDFSFTVAANDGPLLSWGGQLPYHQGPNGTASTFSTIDLHIERIAYSAPLAAVPEASTMSMALMGLMAMAWGLARRRSA